MRDEPGSSGRKARREDIVDHDSEKTVDRPASLGEAMKNDVPFDIAYAREQLKHEQSLPLGVMAGGGAALLGALGWAIITAVTHFQIGFMAIGVGLLVGTAVRRFGRGFDTIFGVAGALLSLAGCALGNLLAVCAMGASANNMSIFTLLGRLDPVIAARLMAATFQPMDVLFYGIALYEGYKLSLRRLTQADIDNLQTR
jgi:hypothetical protein